MGVSNGTPHCTASKSNLTLICRKVGERQGNWRQGTNLKRIERQQLTSVNTPVQCSSRINLSKLLVVDIVFYYHLITTSTSGTRLPLSIHSLQGLPSPIKPLPPPLPISRGRVGWPWPAWGRVGQEARTALITGDISNTDHRSASLMPQDYRLFVTTNCETQLLTDQKLSSSIFTCRLFVRSSVPHR